MKYVLLSELYYIYSRLPLSRTRAEHRAISNKTLGPFSTNSSGVTTRYLELPAISNFLPGPLSVRDSGSRLYLTCERNGFFNVAFKLRYFYENLFYNKRVPLDLAIKEELCFSEIWHANILIYCS